MKNVKINPVAVGSAGVSYWLLQAGWYTLFSRQWLAGVGKTMAELQSGGNPILPYLIALVSDVVLAYVVAWTIARTGEQTAARGAGLGFLLWLGLIATTIATNYTFEARSFQFYVINAGCSLAGLVLVGALVGAWRKKEP
jgi:uncharacterized protein DUF1761